MHTIVIVKQSHSSQQTILQVRFVGEQIIAINFEQFMFITERYQSTTAINR